MNADGQRRRRKPEVHGICEAARQVTICAELDGPQEFMTITVCVPISGSEGDDREYGIARAKDFARGFSNLSPSLFPAR